MSLTETDIQAVYQEVVIALTPQITEEGRKMLEAKRRALLSQVAAIEQFLGIKPSCRNCSTPK